MRRSLHATILAVLALALATPALAQRTTGGISGTVKDASGAVLPGVTVSVSGPNIVGTQTAVTSEHGFYRFINLPPGDYQLVFRLTGFTSVTRRGLRVPVGGTIEENPALEVRQLQESVDVVGESPVVDTTSNEIGSNFGREWVENAPLRRFSFFDLVASAPGSVQAGDGSARTHVYGSSYDENSFQVDGVDITDNYFNEALAEPNVDAIDEVEVLSLGAPAEYGNLTGAVYNIVTRQGSNEFHGDLNVFLQADGLTSNNTDGIVNPDDSFFNACSDGEGRCPWKRERYTDVTAQLGGPIVKDKLWFFASYQYQRDSFWDSGIAYTDALRAREITDRYFLKLNWQLNPKHKLLATFHYDDQEDDNGPWSVTAAGTTAYTRRGKTPTPGLGYTGVLSDKTVLDVRYSGFYGSVNIGPTDPNQPRDLTHFIDNDTGAISGGHYYWYELEPKRNTVTAKLSHLADDFLGASHDFRFGLQYSNAEAPGIYGYNDLVYTYSLSDPGYGYGIARVPFSYNGASRSIGAFLDDSIRVNERLTLNAGLRFDYNKAFSPEQQELDENGQPTGQSFPETDYYTWKQFSPRLGFNWKLTRDGRTVLKGHWGRYHRAVATGEYANVLGPNIKPYFAGGYDVATGQFLDLVPISSNEQLGVDPDYESPRTDQFILSLERELVPGLGGSLSYVNKRGRGFAGWEETRGSYVQVPYTDNEGAGATGRSFPIYAITSDPADRFFQITNRDELKSDINAVSLSVNRPMRNRWQLMASATWMRASGSLQEGRGGAGEQGSGVGIEQRGGLQFRNFGRNPNMLVNVDGRLRSDVEWQLKAQLVAQLPAGFLASANLSHRSGAHLIRRIRLGQDVTGIPADNTNVLILEPRGDNGRTDSVTQFDLRLQKDFRLGEKVRLSLFADALNLLNQDATQSRLSTLVDSSTFWFPSEPVDPRRVMFGSKLRF
jgi:outer membrane receptor protein involved in Fe transport